MNDTHLLNTDADKSSSVLTRVMNTFKRPGDTAVAFRNDINKLTTKDWQDLTDEYNKLGYPTTYEPKAS